MYHIPSKNLSYIISSFLSIYENLFATVTTLLECTMMDTTTKVFFVVELVETKAVKRVQRKFCREFNLGRYDDISSYVSFMKWDRKLRETFYLWET